MSIYVYGKIETNKIIKAFLLMLLAFLMWVNCTPLLSFLLCCSLLQIWYNTTINILILECIPLTTKLVLHLLLPEYFQISVDILFQTVWDLLLYISSKTLQLVAKISCYVERYFQRTQSLPDFLNSDICNIIGKDVLQQFLALGELQIVNQTS